MTKDDLTGFPRLCPDFVVELLSISDSVPKAQQKMERWMENGATLGWLIDPYKKKVYVYEPGREAAVVSARPSREVAPSKASLSTLTSFGAAMRSELRGGVRS